MNKNDRPAMASNKETYDRHFSYFVQQHGVANPKASAYRFRRLFENQRRIVLDAIGATPGRFADVACGVGMISLPLRTRGVPVVALDYNFDACAAAAAAGLTVCRGDALQLPFAGGSFDTVLVSEVIQYLRPEKVPAVIVEACRLVAPGGRAIFIWRNGGSLLHRIAGPTFAFADRLKGKAAVRIYTPRPQDIAAAARSSGMTIDGLKTFLALTGKVFDPADGAFARIVGTTFLQVVRRPS